MSRICPRIALAALCLAVVAGCASGQGEEFTIAASEVEGSGFSGGAMLRVADNVREAGDHASAVSFYQQAHHRFPDDPAPLVGMGHSYSAIGAHDEAIQAYTKALERDPASTPARLGLANTLLAVGRPQAALKVLKDVPPGESQNPKLYNSVGIALDLLGQNKAAQIRYGFGLDLAPDDRAMRNNLALSFAFGGDFETAIALLRVLAREPGADAKTRQNLALAFGMAGNFQLAEAVSRMDLPEDAVRSNLAYYTRLRALSPRRRAVAVLLGPDFLDAAGAATEEVDLAPLLVEPMAMGSSQNEPSTMPGARSYRLRLATYPSREQALIAWEMQLRRNEDLFDGLDPLVRKVAAADGEQPQYRLETVYLGEETGAVEICGRLANRGMNCELGGR